MFLAQKIYYINMEKIKPITKLNEIKILLKTGQISYDDAKVQSKPYFNELNLGIKKVSKKFNKSPSLVSFINFMR